MAVFFAVSGNLRAYEAHARSYSLMGRIFSRAQTSVTPAMSDSEFQDLVRELGREALSENAEWVADHRNRQIEPP